MKTEKLNLTHFIPATKEEVFKYWTTPELIEKWSYPDGFKLKVPKFEAKTGGQYLYEHSADEGVFVCTGHFKEFIPNEKLVSIDTVTGPDGKILLSETETVVEFLSTIAGTEIHITQDGFLDENSLNECKDGWTQCFHKLDDLLQRDNPGMNQDVKYPDQVRS